MKLTQPEENFIKNNKEFLLSIFEKSVEDLKEEMIQDEGNRDKIADLIKFFRQWQVKIGIISRSDKKKKKDNYI